MFLCVFVSVIACLPNFLKETGVVTLPHAATMYVFYVLNTMIYA